MNEEALEYSFNLFKADGYDGTLQDYQTLIKEDKEALSYAYGLFSNDGYEGSVEDFSTLVDAGKTKDPVKETASAGSKDQAVNGALPPESGSLDLEKINKIRSNFGYKPINKEQYTKESQNQITPKQEAAVYDYVEKLIPGAKAEKQISDYKRQISDDVTNIYNSKLKSLPKTEFGTLNFDDEAVTSGFYKDIISEFHNSNPVIQKEILPKIAPIVEEKTMAYVNKLKLEMGLDDPNNITQENIDELKSKANDFYNKNINLELSKDKEFQAINTAFNNQIEELQGPSYRRFIQGKDSPNLLKFKDYTSIIGDTGAPGSSIIKTLGWFVENVYNSFRNAGNSIEDTGVKGYLGYQVEKQKDLERNQELINQYADDSVEGVWITDKQNMTGSWKFIPKAVLGGQGESAWRMLVSGNDYSEGTFADFKKAFGGNTVDDGYMGEQYKQISKRLNDIQEESLILSQWDDKEFEKILEGEDVIANSIALAGEQLPQMALALVTLGASSGAQIGADIYGQGIDIEARKRFNLKEDETPTTEQRAEVLKDDKFMSSLENKAITGGFIAGQLERLSAGKTLKAFTSAGTKSILRGGYKNFLKGVANGTIANTQAGLTEAVTEVLQEIIQAGASGASIESEQLFKAGGTGFISSVVLGVGGRGAAQTATEIKTISKVISGRLNPESSEAFLNNKLKELKLSFDNKEISEEAYKENVEAIKSVRNANASIPKNFLEKNKEKALDLLIEKQELVSEIEGKDPSLTESQREIIAEIDLELNKLSVLNKIQLENIQGKTAIKELKLDNVFTYEFDTIAEVEKFSNEILEKNPEAAKSSAFNYGTIIQTPKAQYIILNNEAAARDNIITTANHEILHAVLYKTIAGNPQAQIDLGKALNDELKLIYGKKLKNSKFQQRFDAYRAKVEKGDMQESAMWEEALTLYSEALSSGDLKATPSVIERLKNFLIKIFRIGGEKALKDIRFDSGKDVVEFIKNYNKSFKSGKWGEAFSKLAKEGAKGKLVEGGERAEAKTTTKPSAANDIQQQINALEDQLMDDAINYDTYEAKLSILEKRLAVAEKEETTEKEKPAQKKEAKEGETLKKATSRSKKILDKIGKDQNGYNPNNPKIVEVLSGMIESKSKVFRTASGSVVNLTNLPGFEMENMIAETIAGMVPLINNFKPKKNDSLFGYLNAQLANKMRGALKSGRVTDQTFTEDISTAKGVIAEETTTKQPEKPKYVKIMDADVFGVGVINAITDKMVSTVRVLKNKLNIALGKNQSTSPLIFEILSDISTQADINIKKAMGGKKDGVLRKFLLKNKQPIIENLTTTFLMGKDQGNEVLGGLPIAIQKQVDGKFLSYPEWAGKKIDRETTEKRGATAGNQIVRRVPANKISDTDYLSFFLDATGNPLRGRKEALAKELAGELGLELFVEAIESGAGPIFDAFEGNRERMGEVLGDYYAGEVIKQVERGTVKFSLSQDVIIETFRELSGRTEFKTKQNLDKLYSKYPKLIVDQIEEEIVRPYKNLWKRINEIVAAGEAKDRGKAYEIAFGEMLNKVGGKITNARINKDGVDVTFQIGKDTIKLETKLDTDAKFGSPQVFGIYDFILNDKEINFEWATEEQNYLLNKGLINMRPAFKSYVDKLLESEGVVQEDGSILISKQAADPLYNKDKDLFEKTKTYIDLPWDIVNSWYAQNNNDIINILEIGAFNLKENPGPYSAYLPEFATYTDGVMDKGMRARGTFYSSAEGETKKIKFGFIFEIKNAAFKDKLAENGGKQINTELGLETFLGIKTKPIRQGKPEKGSTRVAFSLTSTADINVVADRQYKGQFNYDFEINGIGYEGTGFGFNMVDKAMDNTDMFIDAMSEITGVKNVKTSKYQYFVFGERDSGSTEVISREGAVWDGKKYVFPESDVRQSLNVFGSLANNFVKQAKEGKLNGIVFTGKEASRRRLYSAITIKFANQLGWNYKIISRREAAGGDIYVLGKSKFKEASIERIKHSMKMSNETVALGNTLNPSKTTKGISVWDFDDTLATTKSNVLYTLPGGITGKLTAEEFAKQGDVLLEQGAEFDFSEFSKIMQGAKGPMFDKAIERNKKFGNENVYILTARPANSATAIHEFLKGLGLDIKLKNIIGLGNSTAQAKADWVNSKVGEGYNDFYFADDAYKNVKAVQKILEVADVKSKVQQAYVKFSSAADPNVLNKEFNLMLERTKGIKAGSVISQSRAAQLSKGKGRFNLFLPPNSEDFQGILYKFLGTGKQGDADIKFFKDNLLDPFNIAENAMSTFRQNLAENLKVLKKELGNIDEDISDESIKSIQEIGFTPDQAVRVFVWNRMGQEIPDLTNQEKAKILSVVRRDASLMRYARELMKITSQFGGYPPPSKTWFAGNSTSDLYQYANENVRAKYLENWQANADAIFNKSNMTKIEAAYGKDFAKNLKEILRRMKSGSNRPLNLNDTGSKALDYINGSIGTIMFLNMRSAVLQTISAVNFLNWHDNNIFKAGKTLGDPKNFVKTFMEIMNSDFLKQRRDGLEINVTEADIATAVEQSKNKAKAMFNALIKFGYKPTQFADSFAIAAGGTSFLINRTETYEKSGLPYKEAREKAFTDFRAIAEENQQSSRTDRTSNIQASNLGRLVFAFNNTPFQMTRIMKKGVLDLANGRGDAKTNISKIIYYGAVQNILFYTLQQAYMALLFGSDDEEEIDDRTSRLLNGTLDSILRGSGLPGAIISTAKNTIMEYNKQEAKGDWRADHGKTVIAALNFSPPIGSKVSRIYSGLQGKKYEETTLDVVRNKSKIISAITNIPIDRIVTKIDNMRVAVSQPIETWKRAALFLGWDQWSLGVYDDLDAIKASEDKKENKKENKKDRSETMKEVWRKRKEEDKKHRDSIINTFRIKK
jgi:hypothetical protein